MLQKGLATGILTSALILLGVAGALVASGEAVVGIQPGEPMPQNSQRCRVEIFHISVMLQAEGRAFFTKPRNSRTKAAVGLILPNFANCWYLCWRHLLPVLGLHSQAKAQARVQPSRGLLTPIHLGASHGHPPNPPPSQIDDGGWECCISATTKQLPIPNLLPGGSTWQKSAKAVLL